MLLEEELVAVDLTTSDWRAIPLPYLISLHCSAVTALTHVNDISESVWDTLLNIGKRQTQESHLPPVSAKIGKGFLNHQILVVAVNRLNLIRRNGRLMVALSRKLVTLMK